MSLRTEEKLLYGSSFRTGYMATDIKPTRSELLKIKKQIKLAKSGHSLLKKKRDGLILEFFEILKKAKSVRAELVTAYQMAYEKINKARVTESDITIKSLSLAVPQVPAVAVTAKNIMGVVVPQITSEQVHKEFLGRGYGFYGSSAAIDEAAGAYETVVEKLILTAEIETSLKKLLTEIEKTKRRVNALEFVVLPRLNGIKAFIQMRLEEMERENIFRMKRIKMKI